MPVSPALVTRTVGGAARGAAGRALAGTLVFLHGLGESSLGFEPLLHRPELASWRALAPDLRGYGRTPSGADHDGLSDHTRALQHWLRDLALGPVVVVGHSMGGVIGLELCEKSPELVRAFLDVEGNVTLDDCAYSAPIAAIDADSWPHPGFDDICERVWQRAQHDRAHRTYFASLNFADPMVLRRDAIDLVELSSSGELASRRGRLSCPMHYLAGDPNGAGARSRSALDAAGVSWEPIADSGHWPFIDQPENFLAKLSSFLERV